MSSGYCNNPKYWDRQAYANSVDQDQKQGNQGNAASDQGLHCLPIIQKFYTYQSVVKCIQTEKSMLRN